MEVIDYLKMLRLVAESATKRNPGNGESGAPTAAIGRKETGHIVQN